MTTAATALWRKDEHEPLADEEWDPARARAGIAEILADAEAAEADGRWPVHPLDGKVHDAEALTLYLGSAGMIWALRRLNSRYDADARIAMTLKRYRALPPGTPAHHPASLFVGETGILAVAAAVGSNAADADRLGELARADAADHADDLIYGPPGAILAARLCGLADAARGSAELLHERWDERDDLWTQVLGGVPQRHLGAGHGAAANIHALRGYVDDEELAARATRLFERTAMRDGDLVNWAPEDEPPRKAAGSIRVQWCHGAPGIVIAAGDLLPAALVLAPES